MQLVMRVNAVSYGKVKVYSREDPADVLEDRSDVPHTVTQRRACLLWMLCQEGLYRNLTEVTWKKM